MRDHSWSPDDPSRHVEGHALWRCSRCGCSDVSLVEPRLDADGRLTLERGVAPDPAVILSLNPADCDLMLVMEVMES